MWGALAKGAMKVGRGASMAKNVFKGKGRKYVDASQQTVDVEASPAVSKPTTPLIWEQLSCKSAVSKAFWLEVREILSNSCSITLFFTKIVFHSYFSTHKAVRFLSFFSVDNS